MKRWYRERILEFQYIRIQIAYDVKQTSGNNSLKRLTRNQSYAEQRFIDNSRNLIHSHIDVSPRWRSANGNRSVDHGHPCSESFYSEAIVSLCMPAWCALRNWRQYLPLPLNVRFCPPLPDIDSLTSSSSTFLINLLGKAWQERTVRYEKWDRVE